MDVGTRRDMTVAVAVITLDERTTRLDWHWPVKPSSCWLLDKPLCLDL